MVYYDKCMRKGTSFFYLVCLCLIVCSVISCRQEEISSPEKVMISLHSQVDKKGWVESRDSRGSLATVVYDSFACWAGCYESGEVWGANSVMNVMSSRKVLQAEGYSTYAYWPGEGMKVRFFACAPYAAEGLGIPASITGNPCFSYVVPDVVSHQCDLLVAWTDEYPGNYNLPVELNFRHALTAVRFVNRGLPEGVVTEISLSGVYSKAVLTLGDGLQDNWSGREEKKTYRLSLDYHTVAGTGTLIGQADSYFFMIPQVLEDSAMLTVRIKDNGGVESEYSISLKGTADWEMGKMASYGLKINNDMLVVVESLGDWQYGGSL